MQRFYCVGGGACVCDFLQVVIHAYEERTAHACVGKATGRREPNEQDRPNFWNIYIFQKINYII